MTSALSRGAKARSVLKAKGEVCLFFYVFSCEAASEADFLGEPVGADPTAASAMQLLSKVSMSSVTALQTLESTGGQTFCYPLFLFYLSTP